MLRAVSRVSSLSLCLAVLSVPAPAGAQTPPGTPETLTLEQAIQYATAHYPSVRAALEQVNASAANLDLAHTSHLPRLDSVWQSTRGTANNVFGQLLPQSVIPSMSGPVLPTASGDSVWGSAAGALFSWEAFDFGLRQAGVSNAEAALNRAKAGAALTRLEVQTAVASAFLGVVAAQRTATSLQADVERRDTLRRAVQTLVDNQLRPGAEASRAEAERAAAQTRLIRARQVVARAEAGLLRVLGLSAGSVALVGGPLASLPAGDLPAPGAAMHPLARVQQATVDQLRAAENVLARTDHPRVYLQSSVFARGSGANLDGTFDGGADGLGPERANWAAGVQVVLPNVFDFSSLRARKAAAAALTRSETALFDESVLLVSSQQRVAAADLQAAREVAANTPVQLSAARQNATQARARYDAGLANVTEVADAQGLLAQAEAEDQLARIDVWRALLAAAAAQGDITPFLTLFRQP